MAMAIYELDIDKLYRLNYFSFSMIKGSLLILFLFFQRIFPTKLKTYPQYIKLFNLLIFLFFTILIQVHLNFCPSEAIINLVMEQNLTILIVSYNGLFIYSQIFYNLVIYIIIFCINIGINYANGLIVKYLIFSIITCITTFAFIVIRYYIKTLSYLENKQETENLKRKEKLLFNLMPPHVLQNLKEDIPVADDLESVTLLFAGIYF
jgi:hypothetical protein